MLTEDFEAGYAKAMEDVRMCFLAMDRSELANQTMIPIPNVLHAAWKTICEYCQPDGEIVDDTQGAENASSH